MPSRRQCEQECPAALEAIVPHGRNRLSAVGIVVANAVQPAIADLCKRRDLKVVR
jgi:hypothetical protein